MTYRLIATYELPQGQPANAGSERLKEWFSSPELEKIARAPGLTRYEVMVPEDGKALFFDDGPAPAAIVHLSAERLETLKEIARSDLFLDAFLDTPTRLSTVAPNFGLYQVIATPIEGIPDPGERIAGLSFVVRYFEPIEDADMFRDFYVTNHPPILARFPNVRNVFCYLPVDIDLGDLPGARVALGNEVVFDDLAGLNDAMSSSVLADLREDSRKFPPFSVSKHHAMRRSRYFTPS